MEKIVHPSATEEHLAKEGHDKGLAAVRQGFVNGDVVPSTDPKSTYGNYYGSYWDKVHAPKTTP
jgi:hypothetical protein